MRRSAIALAGLLLTPVVASGQPGREHVLQLGDPEQDRPPHRVHADHLRDPSSGPAAGPDHGPRRRPDPPIHLLQRVRGRGPSADIYLRNMIRGRRFPSPQGVFLDRRLTAGQRRHLAVRADIGRDADVLAVATGHPACASGVSRAAARGIAAGRIRTWSAAGVPVPASGNAIALRRAGSGIERAAEPRFGASARTPQGALAARDGGLSEAASGDLAIAAVTSWSGPARSRRPPARSRSAGRRRPTHRFGPCRTATRLGSRSSRSRRLGLRPGVLPIPRHSGVPHRALAASSFKGRGMLSVKGEWPVVGAPAPPLGTP